jgi:membrane-bound serine protease (ClpP class)
VNVTVELLRTSCRSFGIAYGILALVALTAVAACAAGAGAERSPAPVVTIRLQGAIDVPSAEYLQRALREAKAQKAQCLLILLNTPGGLGQPMKDMTEALLNSPVPSIVYVYPAGAFAISAGTFITLSADIAAMHPTTTIGAAHPVELFSTPKPPEPEKAPGEGKGEAAKAKKPPPSSDVMMEKMVNTFALQLRVIAKQRGRNADWAEKAVRESITASAEEAVKLGVVNLLANDVDDLMAKVDGWKVSLPGGKTAVLHTKGAPVVEVTATIKESFLHVLADPNILLVLLVLAGLGIMFELQNPGAILPGVIGGLCLLLSLYAMAALPVNYAGVGLIVFAMLLFLAEVKVPSHGVLTVGGVISFVIGAMMLMDTTLAPALRVSWQVIVVMALLLVLFFLFVIGAAFRAHLRKVQTGEEGMLHARGHALSRLGPRGTVLVEGERWRARAAEGEIGEGEEIEVVAHDGFTLVVRKRQSGGAQ